MDIQSGIHAYIISGADSESRESLAYSLAKKALGGKNYNEALPSKLATAAQLSGAGETVGSSVVLAHPDLHEISPDGTEIKVGQAREVREMAQILPNEAERQVFIFHEADRMNINAQNALLATIEEPPTPCLFLLVCANERALLPTIRSRCAILHSGGADVEERRSGESSAVDIGAAERLARALMQDGDAVETCEAVLPLAKLKGDAAAETVEAARAVCLRAAARAVAGSDEAVRAIAGAEMAAKCLDMLAANVSAAQVAAWVVAKR